MIDPNQIQEYGKKLIKIRKGVRKARKDTTFKNKQSFAADRISNLNEEMDRFAKEFEDHKKDKKAEKKLLTEKRRKKDQE